MIVYRTSEIKQGTGFAPGAQFVQFSTAELGEIAGDLRVAAAAYRESAERTKNRLPDTATTFERMAANAEATADAFEELIT